MKLLPFFVLVYGLSVPFWILGAVAPDLTKVFPMQLPISALMAICPLLAAAILTYRERRLRGVKDLLMLSFDFEKINHKKWYLPIVFLMPAIAVLSYWYVRLTGGILAGYNPSFLAILLFFLVFFVGAIGEEIGWSGYAIGPLQTRYGALKASLILGIVWAIWHVIPWSQAHQSPVWILWQSSSTIFLRVIMVWLFNNTGKSVFGMVLFHTMLNISPYLLPNYGSHYDPFIFGILLMITSVIVVFLWGPTTLARYRYDDYPTPQPLTRHDPNQSRSKQAS